MTFYSQQLGLIKEQITLLDPVCGTTANSSHVILGTALTECHTKFLQVDDDHVYSNAVSDNLFTGNIFLKLLSLFLSLFVCLFVCFFFSFFLLFFLFYFYLFL